MRFFAFVRRGFLAAAVLSVVSFSLPTVATQQTTSSTAAPAARPETVEWVYRIRDGYSDEWFRIFRKYQIAILEKQKQLGYVKDYTIWAPGLHTSEDSPGITA